MLKDYSIGTYLINILQAEFSMGLYKMCFCAPHST